MGPIKKAEELMAKAYGVEHSFFLVNGSSVGNMAMLLSACNPGNSVIVSRSSHKSIMSGIILAGVWPIWIQPKIDQNLDIIFNSAAEEIEEALNKYPESKAVFITSPTYNGVTTDLFKIAELCHLRGKILLVDEAHGAHLKFHKDLPVSAVEAGADLCVQSTHKILSALSQGSALHFNSSLIDINRVKKIISMLQTTSPNYLILASLDLARRQAVTQGEAMIEKIIQSAEYGRKQINRLAKFSCFSRQHINSLGYDLDIDDVAVGGGDEADVHFEFLVAADAGEGAVFQEAEEFGLEGAAHVADFIQEDGAAVGLLDAAEFLADGAGEGAFFMAEEFAFEEVFGDGGAIDADVIFLAAPAQAVEGAGDQLLAGAAFAQDEDGGVGGGDALDELAQFDHFGGFADDLLELVNFGGVRARRAAFSRRRR